MGRPETSVENCHYSLRNNPHDRSLKIRYIISIIFYFKCAVARDEAWGERDKPQYRLKRQQIS